MPRRARLRLADVPVHLIQRGNNRGPCFFVNADYRRYLHLVAQLAPEFGCVVHACVLACCRHIELNPVRAGIVAHPRDYPWSSYRANAEGQGGDLVVPHGELERLGTTPRARRAAYCGLFDTSLDPSIVATIRDATNGNIVLGNASFRSEVEAALGRRAGRGKPGRPWPSRRQDVE